MSVQTLPAELSSRFRSLRCLKYLATPDPVASILVRVKNEAPDLPYFFESLSRQADFDRSEIVFLDSGSTDGTLEYLLAQRASVYSIAASEFAFGATCNLMMALASAEVCLFFSGHVVLASSQIIACARRNIEAGNASGLYFRQIPNERYGASVYDRVFLRRSFPKARNSHCEMTLGNAKRFSNAASAVSRKVWGNCWFPDVIAGEDAIWASKCIRAANAVIGYCPNLLVAHSHNDDPQAVANRVYINALARNAGPWNVLTAACRYPLMLAMLVANGAKLGAASRFSNAHLSGYVRSALANLVKKKRRSSTRNGAVQL